MTFPNLQDLRKRTLANNLIWLRSFGCHVEREGDVIYVNHPELSDYCALLLFADSKRSFEAFHRYVEGGWGGSSPPTVYVDEDAASPQLKRLLTREGYVRTSMSYVTAGEWRSAEGFTEVGIHIAELDQAGHWASIYSLGFGRAGEDAMLDRRRWRKAFHHGDIRHWFFVKRDEVIGVCQTCVAHEVTGIYSFTLVPGERNSNSIHEAIHALRAKLLEDGLVSVYFERVKNRRSVPFIFKSKKLLSGFKVIRASAAYRCDAASLA